MSVKKNPFFRLLRALLLVVLVPVLVLAGWICYSFFDRVIPLAVIPAGYSVLVHTDSVYGAIDPVLDIEAADALLADPALVSVRPVFRALRSSPLRAEPWFRYAAARRADIPLYTFGEGGVDFFAVLDLRELSALSRLAPAAARFLTPRVPGLEYIAEGGEQGVPCFAYHIAGEKGTETVLYAKPYRNLLVVALSRELLALAFAGDYSGAYSEEERAAFALPCEKQFRITADARGFASRAAGDNAAAMELARLLSAGTEATVQLGISGTDVELRATLPVDAAQLQESPLAGLLSRLASLPSLTASMGSSVQYYTLLNAGTLQELKDAVFPLLQGAHDVDALWEEGETYSHKLFSRSIEELLFSWTGQEFAVLGMEGSSDPVIALQIADEVKRQEAFARLGSSILIRNNTSLMIDGVRIPRLELPLFFRSLLRLFKIELPRPYYMVQGGCIFFSASAQNLSTLHMECREQAMLASADVWRKVSGTDDEPASVSLYYNLGRSIPFFLQGEGLLTRLLRLYNIGRCDIRLGEASLGCTLRACAAGTHDRRLIPGFPFALDGESDYVLHAEHPGSDGRIPAVFVLEDGSSLKSLELASLRQHRLLSPASCTVSAAPEECAGGGVLWLVTDEGAVYLLDRDLSCVRGFPVQAASAPAAPAAASGTSVLVPLPGGAVFVVRDDGSSYTAYTGNASASFKSAPAVLGGESGMAAFYARSGGSSLIYLFRDGSFVSPRKPLKLSGPGSGSPCLLEKDGSVYTAFVTQTGRFHLFRDGVPCEGFPLRLQGVFYRNVVAADGYFFALSDSARLYRVAPDGSFVTMDVPGSMSARDGTLCAAGTRICVSTDDGDLYAFSSGLALLPGYPLSGRGVPVFSDVDGDGAEDCLLLAADRKLYAWTVPPAPAD